MAERDLHASVRLDSWKAIAQYLGRDIATVRRWEKTLGLPIRRVGRGHSVFAYVSEIEAWLKASSPRLAPPSQTEPPAIALPGNGTHATIASPGRLRWPLVGAVVALIVSVLVWRARTSHASEEPFTVSITPEHVAAVGAGGVERWRFDFPSNERISLLDIANAVSATATMGKETGALVPIAFRQQMPGYVGQSGQLLELNRRGALERSFSFDDRLSFTAGSYDGPWVVSDYQVASEAAGVRIAVVGRHFQWWPGLVTVIDARFRRHGTFVNAGWIEAVDWLPPDRLLVSGFSNARDGGMLALLDAERLDGQSPGSEGSPFHCTACGAGLSIHYIVFPRSEVNRVAVSPFNRALLQRTESRVFARTLEMPTLDGGQVDVVYEFTLALDLVSASYSDRYWEMHRALEAQGKIHHTRAQCPDRDGPRTIEQWEPQTGWRTIAVSR